MDEVNFQKIPVEKITSSPHQARTTFDDAELQQLAQSMKEEGLIQPITVRIVADGTYEVISGERRWRAAKMLGWPNIVAWILPDVTDQDAVLKGLIENLQRTDLNPIEEAKGYQQLLEGPYQMTQQMIADKVGKQKAAISKALSLLSLAPEVLEKFPRGNFSARHGQALVQVTDKAEQIALAQQAGKEGWSVKQTEEAVNKILDPKGKKKDGKGAKKGLVDPFADVWSKLAKDTSINACNYWTVEYKKDEWNFKASATKFAAPEDFATWFRQMAKSIQGGAGDKAQVIAAQPVPVTPPPPKAPALTSSAVSAVPPQPQTRSGATIKAPARVAVPIPEPQEATYISGDRMQIKWLDLGPGYTYQVMFAEDPERPRFEPVPSSPTVKTPGAIVNIFSQGQSKKVLIAVQAIDSQGHPSELSQPVEFDLKPWNKEWSVLSLPLNVMKPTLAPAAKPVAVAPVDDDEPLDPEVAAMVAEHRAKGGLK